MYFVVKTIYLMHFLFFSKYIAGFGRGLKTEYDNTLLTKKFKQILEKLQFKNNLEKKSG